MSVSRLATAVLALSLGAAACISADDDATTTPTTDLSGNEIVLTSALETVDTCDALLDRIKVEALERVGPYGFNSGMYGPIIAFEGDMADDAMEESAADFDAAATTTQAGGEGLRTSAGGDDGGQDFTETNNQEEGVDEADLVKTDGRRLVTVQGNKIRVIDVEGSTPRLINTVKLPDEFWGGELFLNGDTALLMSSGWTATPFMGRGIAADWYPGSQTGRIMEIDLDQGTIERTLEFEGAYLSAREIDGSIRIVMSATADRFSFVFPSNQGAEASAEEANRRLIEESTIDMWLPTYQVTEDGEVVEDGPVVDCNRVHLPTEFAGFGSLVVLTADIEDGLRVDDSLGVFTDGQTVYASQDRLAVATPRWPELNDDGEPVDDDGYRTAIHTFDITDARSTSYAASGSVRGFLLNQYSLSEHEGHLRVATTDGTPWDSRQSESFVTVLAEDGGELSEVGQVGGLGRGEQIFAVRFYGDIGYVVTFEQIDPLYTIDLSDPTDPTVEGELKIPGFSSYLHRFGNDLLIGVGTDGDEEGRTQGAVVSLFDVSDLTNPTRVDKLGLGPEPTSEREYTDSYSPVSHDARAFNIWGDRIIVPVGWWRFVDDPANYSESNGSSAVVIRVDEDSGQLIKVGEVTQPPRRECEGGIILEEAAAAEAEAESTASESTDAEAEFARTDEDAPATVVPDEYCFTYQPEINRTVVIGDNLYSISEAGVAVHTFDGLDEVTWIPFER